MPYWRRLSYDRFASPAKGCVMGKKEGAMMKGGRFDPENVLAKVSDGKTKLQYQKNQIVFSQGEVADAVFYIQTGKIKLTVISKQGKEAVIGIPGPGQFFEKNVSMASCCASKLPRRSMNA
jgi:hypothetical protein